MNADCPLIAGEVVSTVNGLFVKIDHIETDPGFTHPICGFIWNLYSWNLSPKTNWSRQVWTVDGKINVNGPYTDLDLILE